jgi:hypothetical protein
MKDRIPVFNDIRVIAAIEALKAAMLAVNGDLKVKSMIVQADLRPSEDAPENRLVAFADICGCADCVGNIRRQHAEVLASVETSERQRAMGGVH